ncbi:DUF2110 family protein [Haladaptatus sp. F3-133]|uniref:DUF2110 family protein n=1 Tax=Halorutilus salinus TaxID=2487751 RepID=A0A9Q4C5Z7_9EURY|nr:DUF2110 family protein [Halorutilus salinus]MCX2819024.1 DUF2110 family protein [Halorutilus salinus]
MRRVLNAKIYVAGDARERALDSARGVIGNRVAELEFEHEVQLRDDDRIEVSGVGEDAEAAFALLVEEFGEYTTDPEDGETYLGTLESWDNDGFTVDIGVDVRVPREQLEDLGRGSPADIRERYGLVQHTPLEVVAGEPARLSDVQVDELWSWQKGETGRLNVNSCTRAEVRATVNRAGHANDIVTVERLGLLEQSVVCAPGTDPPGLLASVGKYLEGEMKCVVV